MYNSGTEVIFSCGVPSAFPLWQRLKYYQKNVVGVDIDQSGDHERVITSAIKTAGSVYQTLQKWKMANSRAVKLVATVVEDGVGLPIVRLEHLLLKITTLFIKD